MTQVLDLIHMLVQLTGTRISSAPKTSQLNLSKNPWVFGTFHLLHFLTFARIKLFFFSQVLPASIIYHFLWCFYSSIIMGIHSLYPLILAFSNGLLTLGRYLTIHSYQRALASSTFMEYHVTLLLMFGKWSFT